MDPVEEEKERATQRYHRLRQAAALSRWLLEALAAIALLSWSSNRLPAALSICVTILRRLPAVIFHPASTFLIGNIIVVTLFATSGGHSSEDPSSPLPPPPSDAEEASGQCRYCPYFSAVPSTQLHRAKEAEEVVVYEDKAVCVESTTAPAAVSLTTYNSVTTTAGTSPCKGTQKCLPLPRTRSSALPGKVGIMERVLRRSETDLGARRSVAERWWWPEEEEEAGEEGGGRKAAVAEDDNEEFRRRIEAFISKQLRFIEREEESLLLAANGAVVVPAGYPDHDGRR